MFWNKRKDQPKEIDPSAKQKENRIAEAILSLKYTVADNSNADRKQERREDIGNKLLQIATLLFVILTTAGIFYQASILNKTDSAIHESATAAKDAATAASASASAAQKTAETAAKNVDVLINSERARLLMGSVKLVKNGETDPTPHIDYTWINFGKNPAIINDLLVDCQLVAVISAFPLEDSPKVKHGQFTLGGGTTGGTSGMTDPLPPCTLDNPLTPDDWVAIGAVTKTILFQGFVRYEDAFYKYRWHFGAIYFGNLKFFSTTGLTPAYNQEAQEDRPK